MPHAFALNYIHVVFSTRGRRKLIRQEFEEQLCAYIRGIARNYKLDLLAIGGMEDHLHLLLTLPPKIALADAVRAIKANSSKWMNENGQRFSWQQGYSAFSVSRSNLASVEQYIRTQKDHHARYTFEDEIHALLEKHGIVFNPALHLD